MPECWLAEAVQQPGSITSFHGHLPTAASRWWGSTTTCCGLPELLVEAGRGPASPRASLSALQDKRGNAGCCRRAIMTLIIPRARPFSDPLRQWTAGLPCLMMITSSALWYVWACTCSYQVGPTAPLSTSDTSYSCGQVPLPFVISTAPHSTRSSMAGGSTGTLGDAREHQGTTGPFLWGLAVGVVGCRRRTRQTTSEWMREGSGCRLRAL